MAGTPTREHLGAWLVKCNPTLWDVRGFLADPDPRVTSWAVRPGHRSALMHRGDRILFWVSGDGRDGLTRGIWGLGHVVHAAEDWLDAEPGHWTHQASREAVRGRVLVDIPLLTEPVTAAELRAHGVLDLEVQRMPAGANPSWVSRDQLQALEDLLPPWPSAPDD